jgi:hypothetical protein
MFTPERRLPPAYYLQYFDAVLDGVKGQYGFLLNETERGYVKTLQSLPSPAKMLFARLVNRVGPCFRIDRLAYPEIGDVDAAATMLCEAGLLEFCTPEMPAAVLVRFLGCFTLPELRAALGVTAPTRLKKAECLAWMSGWPGLPAWLDAFLTAHPAIRISPRDCWPFLRFLYFGELRPNLSDFVTRDLGHVVTETIAAVHLRPLFPTRAHADDAYRLATLYVRFRDLRGAQPALETLAWWRAQGIVRERLLAGREWHDRLVGRLGRLLEREGEPAEALALYATSMAPPARERRARLLLAAGDRQAACSLLREMQTAPHDGAEAYVARQLLARLQNAARRSQARAYQQASRAIILDYEEGGVEAAVLAHYRGQGWQGAHVENWLFKACFGLLLWDIIFDPALGVFHSPLQLAPSDLYSPEFFARRRAGIETRLALLDTPAAALSLVQAHHEAKYGIANPLVAWHENLAPLLAIFVTRLPGAGLAAALRHIGADVARHATGLPDLFIWNDDDYRLIEIKSETDHLAGHQFEWLTRLAEAGINVELNRIFRPRGMAPAHNAFGLRKDVLSS